MIRQEILAPVSTDLEELRKLDREFEDLLKKLRNVLEKRAALMQLAKLRGIKVGDQF